MLLNTVAVPSVPASPVVSWAPSKTNRPLGRITIERVEHRKRVVPLSRGKHIRGYHPVNPTHGPVAFESLLEKRVISAIVVFPEFVRIVPQPITVFFCVDGVKFHYTPDFLVEFSEVPFQLECSGFGRETLIEVKHSSQIGRQQDALARNFCALAFATSAKTKLITERCLDAGDLEVAAHEHH